jgi:hypothetical protein
VSCTVETREAEDAGAFESTELYDTCAKRISTTLPAGRRSRFVEKPPAVESARSRCRSSGVVLYCSPRVAELTYIVVDITMRLSRFMLAVLIIGSFVTACSQLSKSNRALDDATLQQKLVGEWAGSKPIGTNQVLSWMTIIHSDGVFSAQSSTHDCSGQLLRFKQWGGRFVVKNGAAVVTIPNSSQEDTLSGPTIVTEPILRLDDHELVIINETGMKVVSRKVLP